MKWFWFPIAVVTTSVALVAALGAFFLFPVRVALASGLGMDGAVLNSPWHGGPAARRSVFTLPPEVQGLIDIPADQRFSHFQGVQINLRDMNDQPLIVNVTPGTITAAGAGSVVIAANDGTSKTFALGSQTMVHGKSANPSSSGNPSPFANGDKVVIVTLNNSATATAVIAASEHGLGPPGPGGAWGPFGHGSPSN